MKKNYKIQILFGACRISKKIWVNYGAFEMSSIYDICIETMPYFDVMIGCQMVYVCVCLREVEWFLVCTIKRPFKVKTIFDFFFKVFPFSPHHLNILYSENVDMVVSKLRWKWSIIMNNASSLSLFPSLNYISATNQNSGYNENILDTAKTTTSNSFSYWVDIFLCYVSVYVYLYG